MVGARRGKVYKLGQKILVRVAAADKLMRTIDFEIVKEGDWKDGENEWQADSQ